MPRREERRRLMLKLPLKRSMLKRLLPSKKNQLLSRKSSPSLPQPLSQRLISLVLLQFKTCQLSTKIFSLPSLWVTLRLLSLLPIINHLLKKTPLKVVMPLYSSNPLLHKTNSSLSMRTSFICKVYTRTLRLSDYSH